MSAQVTKGPVVVGRHYRIGKKISKGKFGLVFEGTNLLDDQTVAIKFESRKRDAPQLRDEWRAYRMLAGSLGFPNVYHFGIEGLHNVLIIDLLGPNLEELLDLCGRRFSLKAICLAAHQMITRVQAIHEKNMIYRDIKPENFLIGLPGTYTANAIHMIDFGMAKLWRDPKTKQHTPYCNGKSLSGTARFVSIGTNLGREQSRRDDLEGLGYVFLYLLRGGLPWQGLKAATNKQMHEKIAQKKQSIPVTEICAGFPEETAVYMNYVRGLGFEETPDYDFLRELFTKMLKDAGEIDDGVMDWMLLNNGVDRKASAARKLSFAALVSKYVHYDCHRVEQGYSFKPVNLSRPADQTNSHITIAPMNSADSNHDYYSQAHSDSKCNNNHPLPKWNANILDSSTLKSASDDEKTNVLQNIRDLFGACMGRITGVMKFKRPVAKRRLEDLPYVREIHDIASEHVTIKN